MHLSVKSVIFDMDGVITHTMPWHFSTWRETFAAYGVSVNKHDIYCREGQKGITSVEEIFALYERPFVLEEAHRILAHKEELFKRTVRQRFIPGARRFLKSLHREGFRLALVTGTSRHELHTILPRHLFDLFEVVVCGTDVTHGKPHPEPYQTALKQLAIKPDEAVVIENAPFGILSAKAAGLRCVALETSLSDEYLAKADITCRSYRHLLETITLSRAG